MSKARPETTAKFTHTFQFSFPRPVRWMVTVWHGDTTWPEYQCAMLYNKWNRLSAARAGYHQRPQRLSMPMKRHVFPHVLPNLCLYLPFAAKKKFIVVDGVRAFPEGIFSLLLLMLILFICVVGANRAKCSSESEWVYRERERKRVEEKESEKKAEKGRIQFVSL